MGISTDPLGNPTGATMVPPTVRNFPYLMKAGATLKVANVRVQIEGGLSGTGPKIRGTNADGFNVSERSLSPAGGNIYEASNFNVANPFASTLTAYYDILEIDWEISRDGINWEAAGTSSNPVYVALDDSEWPATIFHTVAHLALSNPGATTPQSAAENTWDLFSTGSGPTNVRDAANNGLLYYYQPDTNFAANAVGSVADLFTIGTGQCSAWALLLLAAWKVNGVTGIYYVTAIVPGFERFLVKDWSALTTTEPLWFPTDTPDMVPTPPLSNPYTYYDDGTAPNHFFNDNTVVGQGTAGLGECPSEKIFNNHQFLKYDGIYYDPSYGVTYTGKADFQTHLDGCATRNSPPGATNYKVNFHTFSGPMVVDFQEVLVG